MAKGLTSKQEVVLEVIKNYMEQNEEAPTLRELQEALNIKTKRGVVKHLEALDRKGYIYRYGGPRGMRLTNPNYIDTLSIPLIGYANAGAPLVLAEEDFQGYIQIDKNLLPKTSDAFGLVIEGDSMNMKHINKVPMHNGNYIIIEKTNNISNGDVVLAVIDGSATVKTFKKSENSIILYPESDNPIHTPLYLNGDNGGFINGKVIAVLENPMQTHNV